MVCTILPLTSRPLLNSLPLERHNLPYYPASFNLNILVALAAGRSTRRTNTDTTTHAVQCNASVPHFYKDSKGPHQAVLDKLEATIMKSRTWTQGVREVRGAW